MRGTGWAWLLAFALHAAAFAQGDGRSEASAALVRSATLAPDLAFPAEPSALSMFSSPQMAIYKPEGAGPFPALVLLHQCGGLRHAQWQNTSILGWAKAGVAHGYVVLIVDSLGPRNVDSVCFGAKGGVNFGRGVRDALQGEAQLRKLPYVDAKRIAFAGFSWGAMVGLLASSEAWGSALATDGRFRAVASLYPGCFRITPPGARPYDVLRSDVDTPLLVLMGDKDTETPASDCLPILEQLKAKGAPVQWHLYADTTHCWDCASLDGFRKTDVRGHAVEYRYSKETTADSVQRVFAFFESAFARP